MVWLFSILVLQTVPEPANQQAARRIGILVGVGSYRNPEIPTLKAPPHDADLMAEVLTSPQGYGFSPEDVFVLKNERATLAEFLKVFEEQLIRKARPQDIGLFYFSGHGSQVCDQNGDEQNDGKDETLLFHDATKEGGFLVDDRLAVLLDRVPAEHMVIILDACHSGTGTRAGKTGAKWVRPPTCTDHLKPRKPDDELMIAPRKNRPGRVVLSAVTDDSRSAFERGTASNFTAWLAGALVQASPFPSTYQQLSHRVRSRMASLGQIPSFKGGLHQTVFGFGERRRPIAWTVASLTERGAVVEGIPMPGWSPGGVVQIFSARANSADFLSQGKAKATMVIASTSRGRARITSEKAWITPSIEVGDYAVLTRVGNDLSQITLEIKGAGTTGGIPLSMAEEITKEVQSDGRLKGLVQVVKTGGDFQLGLGQDKKMLQLWGPEGALRNRFAAGSNSFSTLRWNLWLHALQRHLLQLSSGHGPSSAFLAIDLVDENHRAIHGAHGSQREQPSLRHVPLGTRYHIKVTYPERENGQPMNVGGLILSSDGATYGFPNDGHYPVLKPGQSHVFIQPFRAVPPLGIDDHILIFGTAPDNPVYWHLFYHQAGSETKKRGESGYQYLVEHLVGTSRSGELIKGKDNPWTLSRLTLRVFQ